MLLVALLFACVETGLTTGPEKQRDRDPGTPAEGGTDTDTDAGTDADSDVDADTDTDTDTDTETDTGTGTDSDTAVDTGPAPDPDDTLSVALDAVFADLDVSPDGEWLYATRPFHDDLVVVATEDLSLVATVPLGGPPSTVRLFPDGRHALVALNTEPGRTLVLDTDPGSPNVHTVVDSLTLNGNGSLGVAPHPDGTRAAAVTQRPDPGVIALLSFPGLSISHTLEPAATGPAPILGELRFTADGAVGYATISQSGPGNDLVAFDPDAGALTETIDLGLPHEGGGAASVAIVEPGGDRTVWVSNGSWVTAGLTILDASTATVLSYLDQGATGGGDLCARPGGDHVLWVAPNVPIRAFDTTLRALSHTRPERDDHSHCVVSVDDDYLFVSTVSGDVLKVDLRNLAAVE